MYAPCHDKAARSSGFGRSRSGVLSTLAALGLFALAVAVPISVSSAAGASSSYPPIPPGPIDVGAGFTLSGPTASYGLSEVALMKLGLSLFTSEFPNGIDGHQVVAVTANDGGTPQGAVGVANQFVADHVAAVFYLSDDSTINPLQSDILEKAHIPNFNDLGSDSLGNVKKYPYVFPVDPSDAQYAQAAAGIHECAPLGQSGRAE